VPILLYLPGKILDAFRWYLLLKRLNHYLPFRNVLEYNVLGQFAALFLPGQISSDIVRGFSAARGKNGRWTIFVSLIADKTAMLSALSVFSLLGLLTGGPLANLGSFYWMAGAFLVVSLLALFGLCCYRGERLLRLMLVLCRKLPVWGKQFTRLPSFSLPKLSALDLVILLGLGMTMQFSYSVGSYFTARSMGITLKLYDWIVISAVVGTAQIVPISLGGLGVREAMFVMLLGLYAVPVERATAFSLVGFLLVIILATVTFFILVPSSAISSNRFLYKNRTSGAGSK
jgi:hypothetical protein